MNDIVILNCSYCHTYLTFSKEEIELFKSLGINFDSWLCIYCKNYNHKCSEKFNHLKEGF